jgi:hypothetical protein
MTLWITTRPLSGNILQDQRDRPYIRNEYFAATCRKRWDASFQVPHGRALLARGMFPELFDSGILCDNEVLLLLRRTFIEQRKTLNNIWHTRDELHPVFWMGSNNTPDSSLSLLLASGVGEIWYHTQAAKHLSMGKRRWKQDESAPSERSCNMLALGNFLRTRSCVWQKKEERVT